MLETKVISSLGKIFTDKIINNGNIPNKILNNEQLSFQVAFRLCDSEIFVEPIYMSIESNLPDNTVSIYKQGYVPVFNTYVNGHSYDFEGKDSGLYPDPLFKRNNNSEAIPTEYNSAFKVVEEGERYPIDATVSSYQGLWITINENGNELNSGDYYINLKFYSALTNNFITEEKIKFEILDASLDEQQLKYTSWFHVDCLADIYDVEIFSERHFEIMRSFIEEAVKTGMNMIIVPAFTPPLDTMVNGERKTAQLVCVKKTGAKYEFDFSLFIKFIKLCSECGIKYFEHSHLFSQWGAEHTPKIIAQINGKEEKIFGWETDSKSEEYKDFLTQYFAKLTKILDELHIKDKMYFHISDEPSEEHFENYQNAYSTLKKIYPEIKTLDALSKYKFYKYDTVDVPIVTTNSEDMQEFIDNCSDFWAYYTGGNLQDGCANRLISLPSGRNRRLGIQLYAANAKGFLHWGYNYYYNVLSKGVINPFENPCNYNASPGTSFVVYPAANGKAIPSIRMKVMLEAINDYRALKTLERLIGREETMKVVKGICKNTKFTDIITDDEILELREEVNNCIAEYCKK